MIGWIRNYGFALDKNCYEEERMVAGIGEELIRVVYKLIPQVLRPT